MQINEVRKDIINKFELLEFNEEEHRYYVGNKEYISVSSQIKQFYEEFPAKTIAPFSAKKWNKNHPLKPKKTAQDILAEWKNIADIACANGHRVHLFGEDYPNFRPSICIQEEGIIQYWKDMDSKYEVIQFELQMYSPKLNYSGTADILLFNTETRKIKIADYKTNTDLFKNYKGKAMLPPFEDLLDCPLGHYYIQLNLYKMLLEDMTEYEVEEMEVVWLKEKGDKLYQTFKIPDLTEKLLPYYE